MGEGAEGGVRAERRKMNTQNETNAVNTMQSAEAVPLEDQSLPASEVFAERQLEAADTASATPLFVP